MKYFFFLKHIFQNYQAGKVLELHHIKQGISPGITLKYVYGNIIISKLSNIIQWIVAKFYFLDTEEKKRNKTTKITQRNHGFPSKPWNTSCCRIIGCKRNVFERDEHIMLYFLSVLHSLFIQCLCSKQRFACVQGRNKRHKHGVKVLSHTHVCTHAHILIFIATHIYYLLLTQSNRRANIFLSENS